jgi:hypothetical protein
MKFFVIIVLFLEMIFDSGVEKQTLSTSYRPSPLKFSTICV